LFLLLSCAPEPTPISSLSLSSILFVACVPFQSNDAPSCPIFLLADFFPWLFPLAGAGAGLELPHTPIGQPPGTPYVPAGTHMAAYMIVHPFPTPVIHLRPFRLADFPLPLQATSPAMRPFEDAKHIHSCATEKIQARRKPPFPCPFLRSLRRPAPWVNLPPVWGQGYEAFSWYRRQLALLSREVELASPGPQECEISLACHGYDFSEHYMLHFPTPPLSRPPREDLHIFF